MEWVKNAWKDPSVGLLKIIDLKKNTPKKRKKGKEPEQLKLFGPSIGVIVTSGEKEVTSKMSLRNVTPPKTTQMKEDNEEIRQNCDDKVADQFDERPERSRRKPKYESVTLEPTPPPGS